MEMVIVPEGSFEEGVNFDSLGNALRLLTKVIVEKKNLVPDLGFLGGKWGYGIDFENDTFFMHPFCWCEEDECSWCNGDAPNFFHKETGFSVTWYKYIGRGMLSRGEGTFLEVIKSCIESLEEA